MTSSHTPGPWKINSAGSAKRGEPFEVTEFYVYAPEATDDVAICADVIDPVTQKPSEANARLIAQAPQLLEDCATLLGVSNVLFSLIAQALDVLIPLADEVESDDERGRLNALISKMRAAVGEKPGEVLL